MPEAGGGDSERATDGRDEGEFARVGAALEEEEVEGEESGGGGD